MGEMLLRIEKRICVKKPCKLSENSSAKRDTEKNIDINLTDSSLNLMKKSNLENVDVADEKVKEKGSKKGNRMFSSSSSSSSSSTPSSSSSSSSSPSSSSVIVHYHPLTGATIATERTAANSNRSTHTQPSIHTHAHTVSTETAGIIHGETC